MAKVHLPHITFEVTSFCNHNCRYCYNIWKAPDVKGFQQFNSYRQARKTLMRLFKLADVKHVTFTGGEPLLAERFSELVLFTRMKKKTVTIISNGSGGKLEEYQQLAGLGVNLFELPVHSDSPKAHNYLASNENAWERSVETIQYLRANKANVVAVIVITKANFDHIDKTLEFIKGLDIQHVMLNRFNIGGTGINENDNLKLSKEELNTAFQKASTKGGELNLSMSSNVCTPLCLVEPKHYPNIRFSTCSPEVSKRPLTLDIFGDLRFCNHSPTVLGNIFNDDLESMLHSEKAKLWTNTIPDFCSDCELYARCMAGCRAASEQLNLSLNSPDPVLLS